MDNPDPLSRTSMSARSMGAPPSVHGGEYEQSAPPPAFAAFPPMHGFGAGGVGGGGVGGQQQHDPSVEFSSFRQMIREAPDDVLHIIERDGEGGMRGGRRGGRGRVVREGLGRGKAPRRRATRVARGAS